MASFGLELSRKLDIRYKSPPLPVNLNMMQGDRAMIPMLDVDSSTRMTVQEPSNKGAAHHVHSASDLDSIMAMFEKDAK